MKYLLSLMMFGFITAANAAPSVANIPTELKGKTITVVVPYGAGGQSDVWNRITAKKVKDLTGLDIVVVNRPGAEGLIGTAEVAGSKPDGLTLLATDNGPVVISPLMKDANAISPEKFITVLASYQTPQGIYVSATSPYKTMQDLVMAIKKNPGKITYGCGYRLCNLIIGKMLVDMQAKATEVNYKSVPLAVTDLIGGHIDFILGAPIALNQVRDGKLRVLAFSSDKRVNEFPDVPLIKDTFPGYVFENFAGIYAPAGTPKHIVDFFNKVYREAFKDPEAQEFLKKSNAGLFDGDAREADRFFKQNYDFWKKIIDAFHASKKS